MSRKYPRTLRRRKCPPALNLYGQCPQCGVSWDAGPIQKEARKFYSPPYRYSRIIGREYPERYDGVWEWQCPDCQATFPRAMANWKGRV